MRSLTFLGILILLPCFLQGQSVFVKQGVLDLRSWNFEEQGSVDLSGEWEFYMSQLIPPDSFATINNVKDYVYVPSTWDEISKLLQPGKGYATYHLKILLGNPKELALEMPHFYSSYTLWINKTLVSSNGQVGTTKNTSIPQWLPKTITLPVFKDTLDVVIHASNFHHAKGGVKSNLILGLPSDLQLKRQVAVSSNLVMIGTLSLFSITFLLIFLFYKRDKAALYFALFCLTWAVRGVFSNLYLLTSVYPDMSWELSVKIEYITLYMAMVWSLFFLSHIFTADVNDMFKYFFTGCNAIFAICTIFTEASLYTQFLPVYLSFTLILLLYSVYVVIRAVVYERDGVWLIVSCIMTGVIVFAYDLIAYQGIAYFNAIITNLGYLTMFSLLAICLFYQLGMLKRSSRTRDILTYEDLYGENKSGF